MTLDLKKIHWSATSVILQNHKDALETCKLLLKENRLQACKNILILLEKNLNALSV